MMRGSFYECNSNRIISIGCLLVLVLAGVHISFSLGILSFLTIWVIKGSFPIAISILATTAFSGIRQYTFAVVPLFVLMGCFMSGRAWRRICLTR